MSDWANVNDRRLGILEKKTDKIEAVVMAMQMELRGLKSTAERQVADISRVQGKLAEVLALLRMAGSHG